MYAETLQLKLCAPQPSLKNQLLLVARSFVEDIDTNIIFSRKRLPVLDLQPKRNVIGEFSKTKVVMMYLDKPCWKDIVDFFRRSLRALEYDH